VNQKNQDNTTLSCSGEPITLSVGNAVKYRRLDKYLQGRFNEYSRSLIQQTIKQGKVKVNGQSVKPSQKLNPKDTIEIVLPELPSKQIEPEDIPLDIIYEDDDIVIVNKQADMIVHPARRYNSGTLVNALAWRFDNLSSGLGEMRPGIVHRLDRNTTGVMVVTKNDIAQSKIAKQFQSRKVKKTYLTVVQGAPQLDADRINAPLGVHPRKREKYAVRPKDGKNAITFFHVLERFDGYSLLEIDIKTGRTHQIRVHLNYIKHPVVADDMYEGKLVYPWQLKNEQQKIEDPVISRPALHAYSLQFEHPSTGEQVKFTADLPEDIQKLLNMLRKYRKTSD
jgi:23S rRNA pseudouridine1911/1915/1917 synthase